MRILAALFLGLLVSVSTGAQTPADSSLLSGLLPHYPRISRVAHISGDVRVSFKIDSTGRVTYVEFISGPPLLRSVTEDSVRSWKFDASNSDNVGVKIETVFSYRITEGCPKTPGEEETIIVTLRSIHQIEIVANPICVYASAEIRKSKTNKKGAE
jgi:TonB family protein